MCTHTHSRVPKEVLWLVQLPTLLGERDTGMRDREPVLYPSTKRKTQIFTPALICAVDNFLIAVQSASPAGPMVVPLVPHGVMLTLQRYDRVCMCFVKLFRCQGALAARLSADAHQPHVATRRCPVAVFVTFRSPRIDTHTHKYTGVEFRFNEY